MKSETGFSAESFLGDSYVYTVTSLEGIVLWEDSELTSSGCKIYLEYFLRREWIEFSSPPF